MLFRIRLAPAEQLGSGKAWSRCQVMAATFGRYLAMIDPLKQQVRADSSPPKSTQLNASAKAAAEFQIA